MGGKRQCQVVFTELGLIKAALVAEQLRLFSAQVRLADRDARYGAHFPGAALLSGVVSVCPQGRLQIY